MSRPPGPAPNLFILGAQKAGTTWLFDHLSAHSQVFGCRPKEPFFWNKGRKFVEANLGDYLARFEGGEAARYRMEASATYLWLREPDSQFDLAQFQRGSGRTTIETLRRLGDPEARFVVMLRQPTARAISAFFHHWRRGRVTAEGRLLMEGRRWGVLDMGFYDRFAPRWIEAFGRERVHFVLFDEVRRDPEGTLRGALDFLGLAPEPVEGLARPRNAGTRLVVEGERITADPAAGEGAPSVWREEATFLDRAYADTVAWCEALFERDLAHWRTDRLEDLLRL